MDYQAQVFRPSLFLNIFPGAIPAFAPVLVPPGWTARLHSQKDFHLYQIPNREPKCKPLFNAGVARNMTDTFST